MDALMTRYSMLRKPYQAMSQNIALTSNDGNTTQSKSFAPAFSTRKFS